MAYQRPEALTKQHLTAEFESGQPDLDDWLNRYALQSEATGSARVFVATEGERHVIGYYALAGAQVKPADATVRANKGQPSRRPIPAALLARLAVDLRHQGKGVGRSLLQDAMGRVYQAAQNVGIRVLLVHAKDPEARSFYQHFGFEPSPTDPLHLMILLKDASAFIETATMAPGDPLPPAS